MQQENDYRELGDYANNLIRSKARQLIGKVGFTSADCDDIEQELAIDLLKRLEKYDPAKSARKTFVTRVIEHRVASMIEERSTVRRDWRRCQGSVDDPLLREGDHRTNLELKPDPAAKTMSRLVFEIDLEAALKSLPEHLRELWELLLDSNLNRVSKQCGVPRSRLYKRLKQLRRALRRAGL